jgi:RNA recognition motif-containing protein
MVPYFNQVMTPLPPLFDEPKTNHLTNLQISNLFANAAPALPPLASTSSSSSSSQKRTKLFVGNLSSDTTLAELVALFSRFGVVNEKLCVVKDDNYAFIHFFSERSADDACQNLNDSFFKNRYIRVQYSTSQGHIKKTTTTAATTMTTCAVTPVTTRCSAGPAMTVSMAAPTTTSYTAKPDLTP